jgi:hypothetical protein
MAASEPPEGLQRVVGLVNRLSQICTQLGDTAGTPGSLLADKLSSIVVVGGQVRLRGDSSTLQSVARDQKQKKEKRGEQPTPPSSLGRGVVVFVCVSRARIFASPHAHARAEQETEQP